MATTIKIDKIFIQDGDTITELTGADKQAFLADREELANAQALLETEYEAKRVARANAITKLAEIAGLTEEEIGAII